MNQNLKASPDVTGCLAGRYPAAPGTLLAGSLVVGSLLAVSSLLAASLLAASPPAVCLLAVEGDGSPVAVAIAGPPTPGVGGGNGAPGIPVPAPGPVTGPSARTAVQPERPEGTRRAPASAASSAADTVATLVGRVLLADTGAPAEAARVELAGRDRTALTDSLGRFRLEGLAPGTDTLRVSTLEGRSTVRPVELVAGGEVTMEIALEPRVVDLGGLEVTVEGPRRTELGRLADRIEDGAGQYITRDELAEHGGRLSFAFRGILGANVEYVPRQGFRVRLRNSRPGGRGYCPPELFVDGSRAPGVEIDAYEPEEIAAIEVYTADVVPGEFKTPDSMDCGAVVMWTQGFVR